MTKTDAAERCTETEGSRRFARPIGRRAVLTGGVVLGLGSLAGAFLGHSARHSSPRTLSSPPRRATQTPIQEDALAVRLSWPQGLAVSPTGAIYLADGGNPSVRHLAPTGRMTTVAGVSIPGYSGDGGLASDADVQGYSAVARALNGSLYIADTGHHCIWRVTPEGVITTVAGTGVRGYAGDGGPATQARLARPQGLALGPHGTLFIADTNNDRVRRVDAAGVITTVAGTRSTEAGDLSPTGHPDERYGNFGMVRFGGDGGPATEARLHLPSDVAVGADGAIYIADTYNDRIRRFDHAGMITTVAGGGVPDHPGDGGPATHAWLDMPYGVAVSRDGMLVIADSGHHRIRMVDHAGRMTTVAGTGVPGFGGDGGPALSAYLNAPWRVALAADGMLVIADSGNHRLRRVDGQGRITTIAGSGAQAQPTAVPSVPRYGSPPEYVTK